MALVMCRKRMGGHWEDWAGGCRGTGGVRVRSGVTGPWEETLVWGEVGMLGDGLQWGLVGWE